jgi:hypothetical protein
VAVSIAIDRELQAALGAAARGMRNRWDLVRLGTLPGGVLDVLLVDLDGDNIDELVSVAIDGLRVHRFVQGGMQIDRVLGPVPFPSERRWPRVAVGWLARAPGGAVWAATSAGHLARFDPKTGKIETGNDGNVPLRQAPAKKAEDGVLFAQGRYGSPVLTLPLSTAKGAAQRIAGLPGRLRDLVAWPGRADTWLWVAEDGALMGRIGDRPPQPLAQELVGDRLLAADLDRDGALELVTSAAVSPGEPDHLVLRRVDAEVTSSAVLFRSPLSGGAVVAAALGRVEVDHQVDVVIVEEVGTEALLWRLEHRP